MFTVQNQKRSLHLQLGTATDASLDVGLPVLAGQGIERFFPTAKRVGIQNGWTLHKDGDFLLGTCSVPANDLSEAATRAYRSLLECLDEYHLCRIWNFVPGINTNSPGGMEHYREFCCGRSLAFESFLGPSFPIALPAATAVGTDSGNLSVIFAAHRVRPVHFENPLQTPAYCYPADYGPRPPSFARATVVRTHSRQNHVFISGTAAIRGHQSVHTGDTASQLDCTVRNLQAIGEACGLGADLGAGNPSRAIKIYLRKASDLPLAQEVLSRTLLHPSDQGCYLRSDICRSELDVEIELSVLNARLH